MSKKKEIVLGNNTTQLLLKILFSTEAGQGQLVTLREAYGLGDNVSIKAEFTLSELEDENTLQLEEVTQPEEAPA